MRNLLVLLLLCILFSSSGIISTDQESHPDLNAFLSKNKKCLTQNVIYDGTKLLLCSDGDYLLIQLQTLHPAVQMRLLMQGVTFYIDPTGRKKEKYAVILPSAHDVRETMLQMEPPQMGGSPSEQRPDIRPLLHCLSECGAIFDVKGKTSLISSKSFSVQIDENSDLLVYSILLPVEQMLKEKKLSDQWRIGIYTQGGNPEKEGPGLEGGPLTQEFGNNKPDFPRYPNNKEEDRNLRKLLKKDIEAWISFSFSAICSINT